MDSEDRSDLLKRGYQTAPIGLCLLDTELRFQHVNEWLASIHGLSVEEHLGRTIGELFPEMSSTVEPHFHHVLDTGEPLHQCIVESHLPASQSQKRLLQCSFQAVRSARGVVVGVSCTVQDITERKRVESALQESELRARSALETTADGFITIDESGIIESFNAAAERIFGYAADEVCGWNVTLLMPPEYRPGHDGHIQKYLDTGLSTIIGIGRELIGQRKDGSTFPIDLAVGTFTLGSSQRFTGIVRDITERKRAEDALVNNANQLAQSQRIAGLGNWQWDISSNEVSWSDGLYRIFGLAVGETTPSLDAFIGRVHPEDARTVVQRIEEMRQQGENQEFDCRILLADGTIRVLNNEIMVVRNAEGHVDRWFGILQDITERTRAKTLQTDEQRVLELISRGTASQADILKAIVNIAEQHSPHVRATILLLDGTTLRHGAAPSMPDAYNAVIDGVQIGPAVGSCGTAAHRKSRVIVEDVLSDPLWKDFRSLAKQYGFRASWSQPIFDGHENVLGTFALYSDTPGVPTESEIQFIEAMAHLAGIAIERKQTEASLEQSEERNRLLVTNAPYCIHEINLQGHLISMNPAGLTMMGAADEGEVVGTHYLDAVDDADKARIQELLHAAFEGKGSQFEFMSLSGQKFAASFVPLIDENGAVIRLMGLTHDITSRHRAEEALRESQERLELVVQGGDLGTWDWNAATGNVTMNDRWAEMVGYTLDEIEHTVDTWENMVHPDDKPRVMEILTAHFEGRTESYETEHRLRHKSGGWVWVLDRGRVIERGADGKPTRACGTHLDITERKQAEDELRLREQQLRHIYDSTADVLYFLQVEPDQQYRFLTVNAAFLESTGLAEEQVVGKTINDVIPEPALKGVYSSYEEAIREKRVAYWEETSQYPTGTKTGVVNIAPIFDESGNCTHLVGAVHDITQRKQAEGALVAQAKTERLLRQELNHRVRNILASLVSLIDLSRSGTESTTMLAESIKGRVQSIANVHSALSQSEWHAIGLRTLLTTIAGTHSDGHINFDGPDVVVPPEQAQAIGLVVHELLTNSDKHGALCTPQGSVEVAWETQQDTDKRMSVRIHWMESGGPPIIVEPKPGTGMDLIDGLVQSELHGHIDFRFPNKGADHTIAMMLQESTGLDTQVDAEMVFASDNT